MTRAFLQFTPVKCPLVAITGNIYIYFQFVHMHIAPGAINRQKVFILIANFNISLIILYVQQGVQKIRVQRLMTDF